MPEATPRLRQVVFVVDASSALSGIFGHLLTDYIVPCLEYLHGGPIVEKHKAEHPQVQYGTVSVNPSPSISAPPCSYYQVTESPSMLLAQLRAIRFERGLIEQSCRIAEGLAASLEMLDMMDRFRVGSHNFNPQASIEKHCILVVNQPPASQPVIASRKYGGQNHLQLAEHCSKVGIHLSVISPRWLAQYKELFLKGTPTPDLTMLQADHALHPGTMVLLSGLDVSSLKTHLELNEFTSCPTAGMAPPSVPPPSVGDFFPPPSVSNSSTQDAVPPSIPSSSTSLNPVSTADNSHLLSKSPHSMHSSNPSTPHQSDQLYVHSSPQTRNMSSNPPSVKAVGSPASSAAIDTLEAGGRPLPLSSTLAPSPLGVTTSTSPNRVAVSNPSHTMSTAGIAMATAVSSRPPFQSMPATSAMSSSMTGTSTNPIHIGSNSSMQDFYSKTSSTGGSGSMFPLNSTSMNNGVSATSHPLPSSASAISSGSLAGSTLTSLLSSSSSTSASTGFSQPLATNLPHSTSQPLSVASSLPVAPPNAALPSSTSQQHSFTPRPVPTDTSLTSQQTAASLSNISAAQKAAEAVLQAAELSSRVPPGTHPPVGSSGLAPSAMPGGRPPMSLPSSMGTGGPRPTLSSHAPTLPVSASGFQPAYSQPQGGSFPGGVATRGPGPVPIGVSTLPSTGVPSSTGFNPQSGGMGQHQGVAGGPGGFPSSTTLMSGGASVTPSQPGSQMRPTMFGPNSGGGHMQSMGNPLPPIKVWSGFLETMDIHGNQRQPRQTACTMFISRPEVNQEIKPQLWPGKLTMTLRPKSIFNSISAIIPINQNTVRTVHFQFNENVQNVMMLKTLMISDPLQKKFVGIVQVAGQQGTQCPIKAFIMVWTEKSRQFTGLIHLDQEKFVLALKQTLRMVQQQAVMQQQQQQQQQQSSQQQQMAGMGMGAGGGGPAGMQGSVQFQQQQQQQFQQPSSTMTMMSSMQQPQFSMPSQQQQLQGGIQQGGMQQGGMQQGGIQQGGLQQGGMQQGGMPQGGMQQGGMQQGGIQQGGMQQVGPGPVGQGFPSQMQSSMLPSSTTQVLGGPMAQQLGQQQRMAMAQSQQPTHMQQQQQQQQQQFQYQQQQQQQQQQQVQQLQQQPSGGGNAMQERMRRALEAAPPERRQMILARIQQQMSSYHQQQQQQQQQQQPFMGSFSQQQPQLQQGQGMAAQQMTMQMGMQRPSQPPGGPGGTYPY